MHSDSHKKGLNVHSADEHNLTAGSPQNSQRGNIVDIYNIILKWIARNMIFM